MPAEGVGIRFEDREFNAMLRELTLEYKRSDFEILTSGARSLLRKLAFFTPRSVAFRKIQWFFMRDRGPVPLAKERSYKILRRGRARAGWWPAWIALRMIGTPFVGNMEMRKIPEGDVIDRRRALRDPSIEMINEVSYIEALDAEHSIADRAYARSKDLMDAKLEQVYGPMLRKHSAFI